MIYASIQTHALSLHDALPIFRRSDASRTLAPARRARHRREQQSVPSRRRQSVVPRRAVPRFFDRAERGAAHDPRDRKSTRLKSSQLGISFSLFILTKKHVYTT